MYGLENWVYTYTDTYTSTSTWFSIDVDTGQTVELSSAPPIIYTPVIDGFTYPDYGGFISPSGRYRLNIDSNLDEVGWFSATPIVSILNLIDTTGDEPPYQLINTGDLFYRKAFWTRDESRVVFGVGPEYGTDIYVLDIPTLTLTPLSELIGFSFPPDLPDWALSPDGNAIALSDFDHLQVVSLDGQLYADLPVYSHRYVQNIRWAPNSQVLFYLSGTEGFFPEYLQLYDLESGQNHILATVSDLEQSGMSVWFFDVAPRMDKMVFWDSYYIWVVTFENLPENLPQN